MCLKKEAKKMFCQIISSYLAKKMVVDTNTNHTEEEITNLFKEYTEEEIIYILYEKSKEWGFPHYFLNLCLDIQKNINMDDTTKEHCEKLFHKYLAVGYIVRQVCNDIGTTVNNLGQLQMHLEQEFLKVEIMREKHITSINNVKAYVDKKDKKRKHETDYQVSHKAQTQENSSSKKRKITKTHEFVAPLQEITENQNQETIGLLDVIEWISIAKQFEVPSFSDSSSTAKVFELKEKLKLFVKQQMEKEEAKNKMIENQSKEIQDLKRKLESLNNQMGKEQKQKKKIENQKQEIKELQRKLEILKDKLKKRDDRKK